MKSEDFNEGGFIDDELKSIRSKLTNTTKLISAKYRKRTKNPDKIEETKGADQTNNGEDAKFSAMFVGQWEKQQNWKFTDIWYLIKYGIPADLRCGIWSDLLRRSINE